MAGSPISVTSGVCWGIDEGSPFPIGAPVRHRPTGWGEQRVMGYDATKGSPVQWRLRHFQFGPFSVPHQFERPHSWPLARWSGPVALLDGYVELV